MPPPEFLLACIPTPYTVLGLKLRPLTIGHILTMQWQGLAYFREEDEVQSSLDDLISGCLICSHTFRGYQTFLQRDDLRQELERLGCFLKLEQVPEKQAAFAAYLAEGTQSPEIEAPDSVASGLLLGSPWLQCLRVCLMKNFHVGSEDTFDYPYAQALWDCFSLRESEGRLTINGGQADTPDIQDTIAALQIINEAFLASLQPAPHPGPLPEGEGKATGAAGKTPSPNGRGQGDGIS